MKLIIETKDKKFIKALSETISRKGYTIYEKLGGYGVYDLEQKDQNFLKNMVAQLCNHYNVNYRVKC